MGGFGKKKVFLEGLCGVESANYGPSEIFVIGDSLSSPDNRIKYDCPVRARC